MYIIPFLIFYVFVDYVLLLIILHFFLRGVITKDESQCQPIVIDVGWVSLLLRRLGQGRDRVIALLENQKDMYKEIDEVRKLVKRIRICEKMLPWLECIPCLWVRLEEGG